MSAAKRQAWFRSPGKRTGRCYSPDHVYTFHIYDQALDYSTFQMLLPLFPIDLVQVGEGWGGWCQHGARGRACCICC
jgi:hypothetical protein